MIRAFHESARQHSAEIALVEGSRNWTYAQLERRVRADALRLREVPPRSYVAIALPRGAEMVATLLAVWEAGLVPLPLDAGTLRRRRNEIFASVQPGALWTAEGLEILATPVAAPESTLYAIATSGSSGRPKVVEVSDAGLVPMLRAQIGAFGLARGKRALWILSPGFDASLSDIGTALLSGATLVCAPSNAAYHVPALVTEHAITHLDIPPDLLALLEPGDLRGVETLVVGGAPSNPSRLRAWAALHRVVSVYGPTEATVCSSLSLVNEAWDAPYLGQPIAGLRYRVVGGELCIGGPGVALGYATDEEATARAFWEENGMRWYRTGDRVARSESSHGLIFLGRLDRQVKLNGQRVELEEIERRLWPVFGEHRVGVVAKNAFVGVFWEGEGSQVEAQRLLEKSLPQAWRPRHWQHLRSLPRLTSGKLDCATLMRAMPMNAGDEREWDSLERAQRAIELERHGLACGVLPFRSPAYAMSISTLRDVASGIVGSMTPPGPRVVRKAGSAAADRPTLLITGATGRLGRALLPLLVETFHVVSLQRSIGADQPEGLEVLLGDVTLPRLGLGVAAWAHLEGRVDASLHLAGRLELDASLSDLLAVNARPLLTLAELGAPLHLASSLAVNLAAEPAPSSVVSQSETSGTILGSYPQSKWVAEECWRRMGLPGCAFRYGLLLDSPRHGELLAWTVRGLLDLGCYPEERAHELCFDVTPLSVAARKTANALTCARQGQSTLVVTAGARFSLRHLAEELETLGRRLKPVSAEEFLAAPPPTPQATLAQRSLSRAHPGGVRTPWDPFLMTGVTPEPNCETGERALAELTLRGYLAQVCSSLW